MEASTTPSGDRTRTWESHRVPGRPTSPAPLLPLGVVRFRRLPQLHRHRPGMGSPRVRRPRLLRAALPLGRRRNRRRDLVGDLLLGVVALDDAAAPARRAVGRLHGVCCCGFAVVCETGLARLFRRLFRRNRGAAARAALLQASGVPATQQSAVAQLNLRGAADRPLAARKTLARNSEQSAAV